MKPQEFKSGLILTSQLRSTGTLLRLREKETLLSTDKKSLPEPRLEKMLIEFLTRP